MWNLEHGQQTTGNKVAEDRRRAEVFRDNLRYVDTHNMEVDAGLHGFRLGLTPFADLTLEEFHAGALGSAAPVTARRRWRRSGRVRTGWCTRR